MKHLRKTALAMAKEIGLINITRSGLCERLGIAYGSFYHTYGVTFTDFIESLRDDVEWPGSFDVSRVRTDPGLRRAHIRAHALRLAESCGFNKITSREVAEAAGVSESLVRQYFNSAQLQHEVMIEAVETECLAVIAQGIVARHPVCECLNTSLKSRVIKSLL